MIPRQSRKLVILMAEDDPDDFVLVRSALCESGVANDLHLVEDGEELMDYLHRRGKYLGDKVAPRPQLILMDLNMPKKDGREALIEIKSDPTLRQIPVVVWTTSGEDEDVFRSYDTGANAYITKPVAFASLVKIMRTLGKYWLEVARLPRRSVYLASTPPNKRRQRQDASAA